MSRLRDWQQAAKENIEMVQGRLAGNGINISKDEARQIIQEILSNPDAVNKTREMQKSLQEIIPVLTEYYNLCYCVLKLGTK